MGFEKRHLDRNRATKTEEFRLRKLAMTLALGGALLAAVSGTADAQDRPNILMICGDDIGQWNVSAYNRGSIGYMNPNFDRIASE